MSPIEAIHTLFQQPPIPYEPQKHTLKGWAKYCLQIQGYRVIYADQADFAVQLGDRSKLYFNVTTQPSDLDPAVNWIIWSDATQMGSVQAATA